MSNMTVHSIESTTLKTSDIEMGNTTKEIHFNIERKFSLNRELKHTALGV